MAIQRGCYFNLYPTVSTRDIGYKAGQIPFQVGAQSQEVRNHANLVDTLGEQAGDSSFQAGFSQFEEGRLDMLKAPRACQRARSLADRFIGRFDAGTVPEDDDSNAHVPWI